MTWKIKSVYQQIRTADQNQQHCKAKLATLSVMQQLETEAKTNSKQNEQGWGAGGRGRDSARLTPMWSGFDSGAVSYVTVEFVVGSSLHKNQHLQIVACSTMESGQEWMRFYLRRC